MASVSSHFQFRAFSATASAVAADVSICWREFVAVVAVCLCSISGLKCIAAKGVDSSCYWFKVFWIYAKAIAAQVIQLKPIWDAANEQLVCVPMSLRPSGLGWRKLSVPTFVCMPRPIPAAGSFQNQSPESDFRWIALRAHQWIAVPLPSFVVHGAETTTNDKGITAFDRASVSHGQRLYVISLTAATRAT